MLETRSPKSRRTTIGRRTRSRTRSDTKASDPKRPSAGRVYFLDESIAGHRLIQAMRDAGANVVPLFDEFERGTPDPVWLPVITSRGWILLTKDDKWRYRHEEMMILIRAKARAFVFVSKTAKRDEIAETIARAIPRMEEMINRVAPPFIAKIYLSGHVVLVYP